MHSSVYETGVEPPLANSDVLIAIATLVTEGRIPDKVNLTLRGYSEGPHCHKSKSSVDHCCNADQNLCSRYEILRSHVLALWQKSIPLCIEVFLTADCDCGKSLANNLDISSSSQHLNGAASPTVLDTSVSTATTDMLLLEQWFLTVEQRRLKDPGFLTTQQLLSAVRSQLHFSQLAAWFSLKPDNNTSTPSIVTVPPKNVIYRITIPGETFKLSKFDMNRNEHNFPLADIGNNNYLKVTLKSLTRLDKIPTLHCMQCDGGACNENTNCLKCDVAVATAISTEQLFDDRMHFTCTQHGKHKCTYDEDDSDNDFPDNNRVKETELKHKPKVRCLTSERGNEDHGSSSSYSISESTPLNNNLPIFFNFEPLSLANIESDYWCRRDYENFIQNQPRTTTLNYFTVPSTSTCVPNLVKPFPMGCSSDPKPAQTKLNCNSCINNNASHENFDKFTKPKFHEIQPNLDGKVAVDDDIEEEVKNKLQIKYRDLNCTETSSATSMSKCSVDNVNDLKTQSQSDILLSAIMRSSRQLDQDTNDESSRSSSSNDGTDDEFHLNGKSCFNENQTSHSCCVKSLNSNIVKNNITTDHMTSRPGSTTSTSTDTGGYSERLLNAACDISDSCKCDILNEKMSDKNNKKEKIYSYTNVKSSHNLNSCKKDVVIYIDKNNCDSLETKSNTPTKNRLEFDVGQTLQPNNCHNVAMGFQNNENTGATPKKFNHENKPSFGTRGQLRDRTNNLIRIISENRKELYKNPLMLDTKRRIDFDEPNGVSRANQKKSSHNNNDSMRKRILLNLNCATSQENAPELDKECEKYTKSTNSEVPSSLEQKKFRKSLDSAASMVFHSRTGLPLTSSPAPIRKGATCFDYDSEINSVSAIRSALFELPPEITVDEDSGSDCSVVSPCSPDVNLNFPRHSKCLVKPSYPQSRSGLLGNFEESVLNGRLEPVSTVQGFTAEIGASGQFCPSHKKLPVTVFFYSLGDMDRMSVPYLGHINLGRKGYNVPKSGLVQITLFNPMGTVVKMFIITYDLSDMPPNSQTFMRQRTLYVPQDCPELQDPNIEYSHKWGQEYLRFSIHLRFMSSKSGRIYLHTDVRMIIFNKADVDTATGLLKNPGYEMRSFLQFPTNPKYSPRL